MRLRADQQLFLSYLALIAILTVAMSVGAESLLRRTQMDAIESNLRRELALAQAIYDASEDVAPDSLGWMIQRLSGRRVTIVDRFGQQVVAETDDAPGEPDLDDYRARPEIQAALEGQVGRAIRLSRTLRTEHLYVATATARGEILRLAVPLTEVDEAVGDVKTGIFGLGAVALLLAVLFSFGFSLGVTRPLRRIGEAARALAAGDLSRRIRMSRDDELGDLGAALNALADELQRRLTQLEGERAEMQTLIDSMSEGVLAFTPDGMLRRANPAAHRMFMLNPSVTAIPPERVSRRPDFLRLVGLALGGETVVPFELTEGGISLLATAHPLPGGGAVLVFLDISELRRLEGVRRDFVANASHELKTPLTAIRGYSETLTEPDLPPDLTRRFAEIVKANADRLQNIVDDLLDLSRIEAGGWRVDPATAVLADVAREVWAAQSRDDKEVELKIEIAPGNETVWADAAALHQILSNLFSNALRYTPDRGTVTFRTAPVQPPGASRRSAANLTMAAERWTQIEVRDSGSGIPAAHLSRIFERFYRADPARSREEGGTGLGLAIVKHLVESHGGWIEAESEVGRGTTIRFVLPAEAPPAVR
ncbi:MAG TPA: ATP-binding protein [Longimicrobiaceae bacterium]|nr:ATP-binding protein [Longimicrobiaceae bacterium]